MYVESSPRLPRVYTRRLGEKVCAAFARTGRVVRGSCKAGKEGVFACDDVCMLLVVAVLPVYAADPASQ